mgnify:CR=1 FL=1
MVKDVIADLLLRAGEAAIANGRLPAISLADLAIERPQNPAYGDYASSLPLKLARAARMAPMKIGSILVSELPPSGSIGKVEVAPPGFINFTLSDSWLADQVNQIIEQGEQYGSVDLGRGSKAQVEFVSANPTGPLTAASGRGGTLGDVLASALQLAGYEVEREYYVNDAGSRMDAFYGSVYARYQQVLGLPAEVPADGYLGAYVTELAEEIATAHGRRFIDLPPEQGAVEIGALAVQMMIENARRVLDDLGVNYDVWFSEQSLHDRGLVEQTIDLLRQQGYVDEREGAVWFVSSSLGEDKDNVLVRSNGVPTYFASDLAYHYDKFAIRGFDTVIDVWGADHQGHVPRMKAGVSAMGVSPDRLKLIIHQLVTLKRGDEIVRMSKRTGDLVTLRDVVDEVGKDACRFFFLSRSADSHMDFDLELAKAQSNENPVYYVQYAHARIASILRFAGDVDFRHGDVRLLRTEPELTLIRKMLLLPELVDSVARTLEPHHLPHYAQDLASVFHSFYKQCRVVSEDEELSRARLRLVLAAKIVLANTLHLMGVTAPEQM